MVTSPDFWRGQEVLDIADKEGVAGEYGVSLPFRRAAGSGAFRYGRGVQYFESCFPLSVLRHLCHELFESSSAFTVNDGAGFLCGW